LHFILTIIVLRTGVLFGLILTVVQQVSTRRPSTTVDNWLLTQGLYRDFWGLRGTFQGLRRTSRDFCRTAKDFSFKDSTWTFEDFVGLFKDFGGLRGSSAGFLRTYHSRTLPGLWRLHGTSPSAQRDLQMAQYPLTHCCFFLCYQNWMRHCIACIVCERLSCVNFTYITSLCCGFC